MRYTLPISLILILVFFACQPKKNDLTTDPSPVMNPSGEDKIIVYQLFTRLFSNTNTHNKIYGTKEENGVGKLNGITDQALKEIKKMGVTHVWYTGVIEHALMADYSHYKIAIDDADVVKGRAGSPYAIKDYYDINPDLAVDVNRRMKEFEELIERSHQQGLKVLIDFVPNHLARQYTSDAKPEGVEDFGEKDDTSLAFHPDNNFYYLPGEPFRVPEGYEPLGQKNTFMTEDGQFYEFPAKATGNDVFKAQPDINDWFETVKLNYGVDLPGDGTKHFNPEPDTWLKMLEILKFWADKGVDGFRCDMAEMVPVEFWEWVIPKIRIHHPKIIFLAEIYNPKAYEAYLKQGQFDYLYDKVEMYDTLRNIVAGYANTDAIPHVWKSQEGMSYQLLRFLENHDEQRIASPFFAGDPFKALPAMTLTASMHTGPVMIYFGQEVGEPGAGESGFSGDDGRTTIFDYWGVTEHVKWVNEGKFDGGQLSEDQNQLRSYYSTLLNLVKDHPAIHSGHFFDLHYFNRGPSYTGYSDQVYAFIRYTQQKAVLVVVNFNPEEKEQANIKIPVHYFEVSKWASEGQWKLQDLLGDHSEIKLDIVGLGDIQSDKVLELELEPLASHIFEISL